MERLLHRTPAHPYAFVVGAISVTAVIGAILIGNIFAPSYTESVAEFVRDSDRNVVAALQHLQISYRRLLLELAACAATFILLSCFWYRLRSGRKQLEG